MIPLDHEKRIKDAIQQVMILCLCALLPPQRQLAWPVSDNYLGR